MSQVSCSAGPQADDLTYTDADLLAQLRAGDEAAMAELVDQWSPAMFRVARSFVDSPQSAEDAVQDRRPLVAAHLDVHDPGQPGQDPRGP
jgi:hypothetical protein